MSSTSRSATAPRSRPTRTPGADLLPGSEGKSFRKILGRSPIFANECANSCQADRDSGCQRLTCATLEATIELTDAHIAHLLSADSRAVHERPLRQTGERVPVLEGALLSYGKSRDVYVDF